MTSVSVSTSGLGDSSIRPANEGLHFVKPGHDTFISWYELKNVFFWIMPNHLAAIDINGNVERGFLYRNKEFGSSKKQMELIYEKWKNSFDTDISCFSNPRWCREQIDKFRKHNFIWLFVIPPVLIAGVIWVLFQNELLEDYGVTKIAVCGIFVLFVFFGFIHSLAGLIKSRRPLMDEIHVQPERIEIFYADGKTDIIPYSEVEGQIHSDLAKGILRYQNGRKLEHLERFDFWPIMRDKIIDNVKRRDKLSET